MIENNQNEYIGLFPEGKNKGVDKFVVDQSLLEQMFAEAKKNSDKDLEQSDLAILQGKLAGIVDQINMNNDNLLDRTPINGGPLFDGGELNVDEQQELAALNVIKSKVVQQLNTKINELLHDDMALKHSMYSLLDEYNLLPGNVIADVRKTVEENDRPLLMQFSASNEAPVISDIKTHKSQIENSRNEDT